MAKRIRVVNAGDEAPRKPRVVIASPDPKPTTRLTENEKKARKLYATTTTTGWGGRGGGIHIGANVLDSGQAQFYSPQLSTDFLEKPQNLRERRAF